MKDYFSDRSRDYARFRPSWPESVFPFLYNHCSGFDRAWDCGTGNGQVAVSLADRFTLVEATDISESQLGQARLRPNIRYAVGSAEDSGYPDHSMDLITVGQAVHWFDHDRFYAEVRRVARPGGLLALLGYGLARITPEIDAMVRDLYAGVLGTWWFPERHFIDDRYTTLPFPFPEIPFPGMDQRLAWTVEHLLGYFSTWSALRAYLKAGYPNPLETFTPAFREAWGPGEREIRIPVFGRVGRV